MKEIVAVYGSLKQGHGNHRLLGDSACLGVTRTRPEYTLYNLGAFPAVGLNGNTAVQVEVYKVDEDVFSRLDMLEGYPAFYNRKRIDTEYGESWMYYLEECNGYDVVEGGVW